MIIVSSSQDEALWFHCRGFTIPTPGVLTPAVQGRDALMFSDQHILNTPSHWGCVCPHPDGSQSSGASVRRMSGVETTLC